MTFNQIILTIVAAMVLCYAWQIAMIRRQRKKAMDELKQQVESTKGVVASAKTLLKGLHDRLVAAGTDPQALAAITSDLKSTSDELAEAVAANSEPAAE